MIYVECYSDTVLVRELKRLSRRDVIHELKGKGEILKRLQGQRNAKGMVDEDPLATPPKALRNMPVFRDLPESGLRVHHDASRGNSVIVLCPRLEEWFEGAAKQVGISLRQLGLPDDPRELHREINVILDRFQAAVQALSSSPRLKALRELLDL